MLKMTMSFDGGMEATFRNYRQMKQDIILSATNHTSNHLRHQKTLNHHTITAFSKLFEYMDPIFDSGRALTMTFLPNHFQDLLRDDGYQDFSCYRTQKLKSKLINYYRDKITITNEPNQQQSVFSSAISIADAVNCAMKYKQLTKNLEIASTPESEGRNDRMIERVGQLVKQDIADIRGISIHPLDPEDINENKVDEIVPESLLHLLQSICGDSRKVKSIAQDIVSAASNGKKRMPMNVGLGISLKNSLRSKEYITKLNNLGHSISYDDVQRIETTWASSIIDSGEGYATLPSNTVRDVFSQAASDNGDFCQENNSQHVTNTVVYQHGKHPTGKKTFEYFIFNFFSSQT